MLNGTTKDGNGNKDYSQTHLQRILSESTLSAGNNPNEADDNRLFADLIRQTVFNQGDLEISVAVNLAKAISDLTQQKIDEVNDLDLTAAARKQSAGELGTLMGSLQVASTDKLNDDKGAVDDVVDWASFFASSLAPSNLKKLVKDLLAATGDVAKELLSAAVSNDTAQVRHIMDQLIGFEDKVIDTTAAANQPIQQYTDLHGNLTEPVKMALGTPDAQTLDDLTPGQLFQLQQRLDAQETTQEIPGVIREAMNRITNALECL